MSYSRSGRKGRWVLRVLSAIVGLLLLTLLMYVLEGLLSQERGDFFSGSWTLLEEQSPCSLSSPGRALKPLRRVAECTGKQAYVMLDQSVYLFPCSYVKAVHKPLAERLSNIFICGMLNAHD